MEERENVTFAQQMGSVYLFSDGERRLAVGSEIYWVSFTVWTLPLE